MKISETYTLRHLTQNQQTRDVILKHLKPIGVDETQLLYVHATLKDLTDTNMGGGIPYEVMQKLVAELDAMPELLTS